MRLLSLLAVLVTLAACDISRGQASYIDKQVENLDFDIHEVEYSTTPKRFNVASYSHINRGSKSKIEELAAPTLVSSGAYGDWIWKVYADKQAQGFASGLVDRKAATIPGKQSPRTVILPSWNDAFTEFAKTAGLVFGTKNLPLEVHITIVGQPAEFKDFVVHNDDGHLILDYYFGLDVTVTQSAAAEYQWLVDTVATVGHEYSHAFIYEQDIRLPNAITNEVMAYTLEQCVKLAVVGSQAGISYLDKGGKEIDPGSLDFSKLVNTRGSASLNAYYLAEYDTVHVLGTSSIDKDDVALKDRLMGLCVSQYQHVNDFEQSFYPAEYVQPVVYTWNDYQSSLAK